MILVSAGIAAGFGNIGRHSIVPMFVGNAGTIGHIGVNIAGEVNPGVVGAVNAVNKRQRPEDSAAENNNSQNNRQDFCETGDWRLVTGNW